jgi:hypothetical protein
MRSRQQTKQPSELKVKFLVEDNLRPESVVGQTQPEKQENKLIGIMCLKDLLRLFQTLGDLRILY